VIQAAKVSAHVLLLAAVCLPAFANIPRTPLVAEKPHLGVVGFVLASHRAESVANSLIAPGLPGCLYDSCGKPCSSGKERDAETGLDFFEARYLSSAQGRFTSPDEPFIGQSPLNPQSWNLYSYGLNNPLRYIDPTGRKCVDTNNGPADDGTGGGCAAAGVDANGNITPQTVNAIDVNVRNTGYGQEVSVNGRLVYESGLQRDYASELLFLGLFRGLGGGRGAGAAGAGLAESSIWNVLPPTARGGAIEQMLGANLPRTFPVIDRFLNGVATSIKSLDLRAVSHLDPTKLERTLLGHVDKVAGFGGGRLAGAAVEAGQITGRALEVAVPHGTMNAAQQAVFSRVTAAAAAKGVQVIVVPIK